MEYVTLNNGIQMPVLGYGVLMLRENVTHCEKVNKH